MTLLKYYFLRSAICLKSRHIQNIGQKTRLHLCTIVPEIGAGIVRNKSARADP